VAVVGARKPTPYGEAVAESLAGDLAAAGVTVVSGLARGIDAAAHRGALDAGGCTLAVLGSGVDVIYPPEHGGLAQRVLASGGAIVSQFPDGTRPQRHHFPMRNWTMAALSDAVVVVEAAQGSGSLITADAALSLGRDVLAVPGSVFSPLSVGCHQLLRDGAALAQNARDVLACLGRSIEVLDDPLKAPSRLGLETVAPRDGLIAHLSDTLPMNAEELARKLAVGFPEVLARLSRLELEGIVARQGSGYVRLVRRRGTG
jgi:DNA processing protein